MPGPEPFVPPPYPYERLDGIATEAASLHDPIVDLSIGTPCDPPPAFVVRALATSGAERGYPPSIGSLALRSAAVQWMERRFGVEIPVDAVAACVGTKELVGTLPQWMRLRRPDRDTVLYPAISYPTYEMGAVLAGCRPVPVPCDGVGRPDLAGISETDASRALLLWVNSPANPSGGLTDLRAAATWGRRNAVPVFSDECYAEFTWEGPPRTILEDGVEGVVAVHSLSKRSNLAGLRVGFYTGDPELVDYLREVRKHVGMMVPGPVQAAAVAALGDDDHVVEQRERYRRRLDRLAGVLERWTGGPVRLPDGGFYLWFEVGDAWELTRSLALKAGAVVSPGELYGIEGARFVRAAVVQPDERLALVAARLGV